MEKIIQVKELGAIRLRRSPRAKHYTLKIFNGSITAIMPVDGEEKQMRRFIQNSKEKLLAALAKCPALPLLTENTVLQTASFQLHIFRENQTYFYMTLKNNILHIACPQKTNFAKESVQQKLKIFIEQALLYEACQHLPNRLQRLADQHGFTYTSIKITGSKTRWGSCTARRSINLSIFVMLLPWHLIDYVLLHELCHTKEMNHGERFWALMDQVTNGETQALKKELKSHHMLW